MANWKTRLTKKLGKAEKMPNVEEATSRLKPSQTSVEDWASFVASKRTDDFRVKSKKQSERSKKNKYQTCIGRQSMANVAARLLQKAMTSKPTVPPIVRRSDIWRAVRTRRDPNDPNKLVPLNEDIRVALEEMDKLPDSNDLVDDPVARVLGREYPGRVRSMGHGVTPTTMNLTFNNERRYQLVCHEHRTTIAEKKQLESRLKSVEESQSNFASELSEIRHFLRDLNSTSGKSSQESPSATTSGHAEPLYTLPVELLPNQPELHGRKCVLLHYDTRSRIVVAKAEISVTDPTARCHILRIGRMFYRVNVERVVPGFESLDLPMDLQDIANLGEAVNTHIPWPRHYIELI